MALDLKRVSKLSEHAEALYEAANDYEELMKYERGGPVDTMRQRADELDAEIRSHLHKHLPGAGVSLDKYYEDDKGRTTNVLARSSYINKYTPHAIVGGAGLGMVIGGLIGAKQPVTGMMRGALAGTFHGGVAGGLGAILGYIARRPEGNRRFNGSIENYERSIEANLNNASYNKADHALMRKYL